MVMRKYLSLLLVVTFLLTSCGNKTTTNSTPNTDDGTKTVTKDENVNPAGEFPIVNEEITLTISVAPSADPDEEYSENYLTKQIEELTNINLKWDYINESAFIENVNMMFASGELSDVVVSGVSAATRLDKARESQISTQGMIVPLDGLIDEYAPNIKKGFDEQNVREFIKQPDGRIYSIPTITNDYHGLWSAKYWINDTWLDNLGLAYPTTPDELYDTLVAFRDDDPNKNGLKDEIPFSTCKSGNMVGLDIFLMNAFTYSPGPDRLYLEDGKVVFTSTQPGYAEGLSYLNKLYSEELIYVDSFSQDQKAQVALNENGEVPVLGGWVAQHLGYGCDLPSSDKWKQYQALEPLDGPNPEAPIATYNPFGKFITGHLAITRDCKNPAAAIRLVDYFYTDEGVMAALGGREGFEWEAAKEGEVGLDGQPAKWNTLNVDRDQPEFKNIKWGQMFPTYRDTEFYSAQAFPADPYAEGVDALIGRMVILQNATRGYEAVSQKTENCLPTLAFSDDVAAEAVQLKTTIDQYVDEMVAAFTTGNSSVEEDFDAFLQELDKMGLPRYIEIMQEAYDAAYPNK